VEVDALSADVDGDERDGLPAGVDRVGEIPDQRGRSDPVLMVRVTGSAEPRWAFSRQTVARIDEWYDALPDRWVRDWLPISLQRWGPFDVMWWQWLAIPLLLALALAFGRLAALVATRGLLRVLRRTPTAWDEQLLVRIAPALTVLLSVAIAGLLLPWLGLVPRAYAGARALLAALATVGVFWAVWRAVDVWAQFLQERSWAASNPSARSLLAASRNIVRVLVLAAGAAATLAALGYPVATVLAGLGIGGIAIAFGAQKTIENLFGSIALAADQPFRVGDFVKIEDAVVGNVEQIGMRSTQIRTLDRTLVSIPNGKLADMRIEDFAARDRIRLACTLGLVYGTRAEQLERILAGLERVLREHPKIWPDTVVVRFEKFGASSLDVNVMAWFATSDFNEFQVCREQALLGFMRVVEAEGSSFAFPTRTVHVVGPKPEPAEQPALDR
jgi:MscS family membrane protein